MKQILASIVLLAAFTGALFAANNSLTLRPDTNIQIVEEGEFGNARGWATETLQKYLLGVLGRKTLSGPGDTVTFVIRSRAALWTDLPGDALRNVGDVDAFEIEIVPGENPSVRIAGATALAANFGTFHFIEKHLGVLWLFPGEIGTHIPNRPTVQLKAGKEQVTPTFFSRLCTGFIYRDKSISPRKLAHEGVQQHERLFFWSFDYYKSHKLHFLAGPSHNMIQIFPVKETKENHPELFPIKDGKPHVPPVSKNAKGHQNWHPCYTNPKAVAIATEKAKAAFAKGALCFSLGINDGKRVQCQCAACKAAGWPDSYYRFVTRVADNLKGHYPPRIVGVIAYGDVTYPPKDLKLPPNVLVMCASGGPERLDKWSPRAAMLGTYEWAHGQGYWYPNIPLAAMESNAAYYKKHKVQSFRSEVYPTWAFDGPRVWLRLRQLWEPDLDLDAGLARYCAASFGRGGDAMTRLYRHWAKRREGDVLTDGVTPHHAGTFRRDHWRNILNQFATISKADYDFSLDRIREARALIADPQALKRLAMVHAFFEEAANLYGMHLFRNRAFDPAIRTDPAADVAEAVRRLETRAALLTEMQRHPEWLTGLSAKVDEDLVPTWEARGANPVPGEMRNVILTTLVRQRMKAAPPPAGVPDELKGYARRFKVQPLLMHSRPKHPWYKEEQFVRLDATRRGNTIKFKTQPTTVRIEDHPTLAGLRKPHWMAVFVLKAPFNTDTAYQFDFDAKAKAGSLSVRVTSGPGSDTAFVEEIPAKLTRVRRSIVFAPLPRDRKTGNLNVYMTWSPATDASPLEGQCALKRLDFTAK